MTSITYRDAVIKALSEEMARDDSIYVIGEDIAAAGGVFKATAGLVDQFGTERVRDTPISEQAIVGCAIGSAATGLRPVVEVMFADFAGVCFDQIANQLAKYRYMTGGQTAMPVTVRLVSGATLGFGAQHSQAVENWFLNIPGLKVCVPGTPEDMYGLMKHAIRDENPVLVFEHKALYGIHGEFDGDGHVAEIGTAVIARPGRDVTIVATQLMRQRAIEAAHALASEGVDAEVIDPRTLVPFDLEAVVGSVQKTNRLLCVQEAPVFGGWGASVVAGLMDEAFDHLDAPPVVVGADATPIPYAGTLEEAWVPSVEQIADAVRRLLR